MKRWIGMGILCLAAAANAQTPAVDPVQPAPPAPPHVLVAPPPMPLHLQQQLNKLNAEQNRLNLILRSAPGQQLEKAAYLGVSVSPVPPALREQLKLQPGMGLLVDHVDKGSPAESAGIKQFDVLQKIDDQLLINANQLQVLVRNHKPGEEIRLSIVHQGEKTTIPLKLAEHELPPLSDAGPWNIGPELGLDLEPNVRLDQLMQSFPAIELHERPTTQPAQTRQKIFDMMIQTAAGDSNTLTVTVKDGQEPKLTVRDKDGKIIYDGPMTGEEALKVLPQDIRRMIERMGLTGRLELRRVVPPQHAPVDLPDSKPENQAPAPEHQPAPTPPAPAHEPPSHSQPSQPI